MAKITIFGENGELKTITGTFSKLCEITSSYADEQKFVDAILNGKNIKYKTIYFEDSRAKSRKPIFARDVKRVNQALNNQDFITKYLIELPKIFSNYVRDNVDKNPSFYHSNIYKTMLDELSNIREKDINEYYNFLIELMKKYNYYLTKKNEQQEIVDYSKYVQAAYDNIKKEIEERFGQKEPEPEEEIEVVEESDEYESDDYLKESVTAEDEKAVNLDILYSYFRTDGIDDNDVLKTTIISNDFDAKKQLTNILNKCNTDFENNYQDYKNVDFIILIGNDIRNDIRHFMNFGKPILAISLDKEIKINDNVVTVINGLDEEKIVSYLIKMHKECKKERHYE